MKLTRLIVAIGLVITTWTALGAGPAKVRSDTYTVEEARAILDYNQNKNPDQDWSIEQFAKHRLALPADQLRPTDRFDKKLLDNYVPTPPTTEPKPGAHFLGLKIRASFSDTLSSEDPTVQGDDQPATPKDLKGASFSYQHDFRVDSDAWAAKGALILPFTGATSFAPQLDDPPGLHTYGFIPSISFDRETNSADKTKSVDSLIFRAGLLLNLRVAFG